MVKKPKRKEQRRVKKAKKTRSHKPVKGQHKKPDHRVKKVRRVLADAPAESSHGKKVQGRTVAKVPQVTPNSPSKGTARCYYEPAQRWMTYDEVKAWQAAANSPAKGPSVSPAQRAAQARVAFLVAHLTACNGKPIAVAAPQYYDGLTIEGLTSDDVRLAWILYKEQRNEDCD